MPISEQLEAEAALCRCGEAEAGWEQLPEQAGVADQPPHRDGPGPSGRSQPCGQPAHKTHGISPSSFSPSLIASARSRLLGGAASKDTLHPQHGCPGTAMGWSCREL